MTPAREDREGRCSYSDSPCGPSRWLSQQRHLLPSLTIWVPSSELLVAGENQIQGVFWPRHTHAHAPAHAHGHTHTNAHTLAHTHAPSYTQHTYILWHMHPPTPDTHTQHTHCGTSHTHTTHMLKTQLRLLIFGPPSCLKIELQLKKYSLLWGLGCFPPGLVCARACEGLVNISPRIGAGTFLAAEKDGQTCTYLVVCHPLQITHTSAINSIWLANLQWDQRKYRGCEPGGCAIRTRTHFFRLHSGDHLYSQKACAHQHDLGK